MDRQPQVSLKKSFSRANPTKKKKKISFPFPSFQYICLACLPRKNYFTGYSPLRMHLRAFHRHNRRFSVDDSNRHRADGGYILDGNHHYPGDASFEPWRAIGYGTKPIPKPEPAASIRGFNMTPSEFSTIVASLMNNMQQQVSSGVQTTLQNASVLMGMMTEQQNVSETNSWRCFPVSNSHNVLVSINNPAAVAPKVIQTHGKYPAQGI